MTANQGYGVVSSNGKAEYSVDEEGFTTVPAKNSLKTLDPNIYAALNAEATKKKQRKKKTNKNKNANRGEQLGEADSVKCEHKDGIAAEADAVVVEVDAIDAKQSTAVQAQAGNTCQQ